MSDDTLILSKWLVFIDTNVLLDFYRLRGNNALEFLAQIDEHKSSLILTRQVLMEFLKNRRTAISLAFGELSKPVAQKLPPNLRGMEIAEEMFQCLKAAEADYKKLKEKTELILTSPADHDDVYCLVIRLFSGHDQANEAVLLQRAQERSLKGFPPRKVKDTTLGDAMNWEAMLHAIDEDVDKPNLFIVSRDGDFSDGPNREEINEWLSYEFKEKFGEDREVVLSNSLSEAMKRLGEAISQEAADEEQEVIEHGGETFGEAISVNDSLASLGRQITEFSDPLADLRKQMERYVDPLADLRKQMERYVDPLADLQKQMERYADPLADLQKQMERYVDPLAALRKQSIRKNDPNQDD